MNYRTASPQDLEQCRDCASNSREVKRLLKAKGEELLPEDDAFTVRDERGAVIEWCCLKMATTDLARAMRELTAPLTPMITELPALLPVQREKSMELKHVLVFILNGEDVTFPVEPGMPLRHVRNSVLELTGNTGRSPEEWEIRDVYGNLISPDENAVSFAHGQRFFCTIVVGAGGA